MQSVQLFILSWKKKYPKFTYEIHDIVWLWTTLNKFGTIRFAAEAVSILFCWGIYTELSSQIPSPWLNFCDFNLLWKQFTTFNIFGSFANFGHFNTFFFNNFLAVYRKVNFFFVRSLRLFNVIICTTFFDLGKNYAN